MEEEDRDERQRQEPDTTSDQVSGVACRVTGAHVWEVVVSLLCGVTTLCTPCTGDVYTKGVHVGGVNERLARVWRGGRSL